MTDRTTLGRLAVIIRSKNAGPYITTCDVMFERTADLDRVRAAGVLTRERIAALYHLPVENVLGVYFYPPARAIKISFLKLTDSGDPFSPDIAGSSQHVPLLDIEV